MPAPSPAVCVGPLSWCGRRAPDPGAPGRRRAHLGGDLGASDDVNIANQAWNPRTGRGWARGDAQVMWSGGMGGFTDRATGAIYINAQTALQSHVPHEVLHANACLISCPGSEWQ